MPTLPRFTVRHLLAATTVIALALAALRWSVSWEQLNPDSERFTALGTSYRIRWNEVPWERAAPGENAPVAGRFVAAGSASCPAPIYLDQALCRLTFANFSGRRTNSISVYMRGACNEDRTAFSFGVFADGGARRDGACEVAAEYDDATRILRVNLRQTINSRRSTREAELVYVYDGSEFRLLESESALGGFEQVKNL